MTTIYSAGERLETLICHQAAISACRVCPNMIGPPVVGEAVLSSVMLMGQAPGTREIEVRRPFAWTAGKTLFGWFESIGIAEQDFRQCVFMTAVCRCFPGKNPRVGDRVPSREEIGNCAGWWQRELALVRPRLIIPLGRLAIAQFTDAKRLEDIVGKCWVHKMASCETADLIPLPHPSGASTWFKTQPGKNLLADALRLIGSHPAWRELSGI